MDVSEDEAYFPRYLCLLKVFLASWRPGGSIEFRLVNFPTGKDNP